MWQIKRYGICSSHGFAQTAEKNLKGYLIAKSVETPPKIHDLRELCYFCAEYDKAFDALVPHCVNLNVYGVRVRYPDEIEVDESKARQAIADAQTLQSFEPIVSVRAEVEAGHKTP